MEDRENNPVYIIPANYSDSGRLFGGMLAVRNAIEALILAVALGFVEIKLIPMPTTVRIVVMVLTILPTAVVAMMGIDGESLTQYPASYPSQLFFLKENTGYEIVVLYEGEGNLLRLLQLDEELKYIIVLPHISMAEGLKLPSVPCLFATVDFCGEEEPTVTFYSEDKVNGKP